jgi:molybdopterin converting factor small subunit
MAVTVRTLRPLADWLGNGRIEIDWPGGTLEDLILCLAGRTRSGLEKELRSEDGSLAYLFSVNGKIFREPSAAIHDGDEVFIFAPMGGG